MPSETDIAFANALRERKVLPERVIEAALAEVDRVTKLGLDKYLSTILVEEGRLTPQQVKQLRAESEEPEASQPAAPSSDTEDSPPAENGSEAPEAISMAEALEELGTAEDETASQEDDSGELVEAKPEKDDDDRGLLAGVYACAKCGAVVDEDDIKSGAAEHMGGRLYCAKCKQAGLEDGQIAAGYRIGGQVHATRLGQVYKCKHLATGRICAVEVIPEKQLGDGIPLNRLVQLGNSAAVFEHERLLKLHEIVQWQKSVYIEREYVNYSPLTIFLKRRCEEDKGPFSASVTLKVLRQLVQALVFAFDRGLVHGAITPDIVYMNKEAEAKLASLGLPPLGPPVPDCPYVAPELRGATGTIDCRVDIYSIGAVAYEMLTLTPPPAEREGPLQTPENTPYHLDRLIGKMTALSGRERFAMPRHVLRSVEESAERLVSATARAKEITAEIYALQAKLAASVQRLEQADAAHKNLTAKRDASLQKLQQGMPSQAGQSASRGQRREMKRQQKETERGMAVVGKGFKRQAKDLTKAIEAERSVQESLQKKIEKKIEQRQQVEREG